jgi:hypothetical protein
MLICLHDSREPILAEVEAGSRLYGVEQLLPHRLRSGSSSMHAWGEGMWEVWMHGYHCMHGGECGRCGCMGTTACMCVTLIELYEARIMIDDELTL